MTTPTRVRSRRAHTTPSAGVAAPPDVEADLLLSVLPLVALIPARLVSPPLVFGAGCVSASSPSLLLEVDEMAMLMVVVGGPVCDDVEQLLGMFVQSHDVSGASVKSCDVGLPII